MSDKVVTMPARKRSASRTPARAARPRVSGKARGVEVLQILRARIANQDIPPGAKLKEQELSEEFGVPRTRIREVFSALESRGLIERIPNRGAVVTRLDLAQVYQLYDVREVLEGLLARQATENAPAESWQDLVDFFAGPMQRLLESGELDRYIAGYEMFRARVTAAADNAVAAQMIDSIFEKTKVVIHRIIILPGRAEVGLVEHRAVLAAMRRGDAAEAERLRRANMRSAKAYLQRYQKFVL